MTSDEAWAALCSANQEKDLDDFKVFFLEYVRNNKELTFVELEKMFREHHFEVYLIAMVIPIPSHLHQHPFIFPSHFPYLYLTLFLFMSNFRKKKFRNKRQFAICKEKRERSISFPSNLVRKIAALGTVPLAYLQLPSLWSPSSLSYMGEN